MFQELELALQTLPSKALDLAVRVLITVLVFFVGMKLIKLVRKILRKSLTHADAEIGLIQFLDSFVKYTLYAMLIFARRFSGELKRVCGGVFLVFLRS